MQYLRGFCDTLNGCMRYQIKMIFIRMYNFCINDCSSRHIIISSISFTNFSFAGEETGMMAFLNLEYELEKQILFINAEGQNAENKLTHHNNCNLHFFLVTLLNSRACPYHRLTLSTHHLLKLSF